MTRFRFDEVDDSLDLVPMAGRRALDQAGLKLSLVAWRTLSREARDAIVRAGSADEVDVESVRSVLARVEPPPTSIDAVGDPPATNPPVAVTEAFGAARPIHGAVWSALTPLARYALAKVAAKPRPDRLDAAYAELVGASDVSTHLSASGSVRMVGVAEKGETRRRACAESRVSMGPEAFDRLTRADTPKGDVLGTARLAGIMGAKRTHELIPLCHPVRLTHVAVELELEPETRSVRVEAVAQAYDRTGVEMEALTAASTAALTLYDMLKAFDRGMVIGPTRLLEKSGGRSGDFHA